MLQEKAHSQREGEGAGAGVARCAKQGAKRHMSPRADQTSAQTDQGSGERARRIMTPAVDFGRIRSLMTACFKGVPKQSRRSSSSWLLCAALALAACGGEKENSRDSRSPSHDYGREPPRSTDGQVIGADGRPPGDTLRQGPTAGTDGVKPAPGWHRDEKGLHYDPEHQDEAGHQDDDSCNCACKDCGSDTACIEKNRELGCSQSGPGPDCHCDEAGHE
jgi:hypothetical protein